MDCCLPRNTVMPSTSQVMGAGLVAGGFFVVVLGTLAGGTAATIDNFYDPHGNATLLNMSPKGFSFGGYAVNAFGLLAMGAGFGLIGSGGRPVAHQDQKTEPHIETDTLLDDRKSEKSAGWKSSPVQDWDFHNSQSQG